MENFKRIVLSLIFILFPMVLFATELFPSKIYIEVKVKQGQAAALFKDSLTAGFHNYFNIVVLKEYQITNFTETDEAEKFLLLNNIQGFIKADITKNGDDYEGYISPTRI